MADDYGNSTATAGALAIDGQVDGSIETPGDRDWFRVSLQAGVTYFFELRGADSGSGTLGGGYPEARLVLYDGLGYYARSSIGGGIGDDPLMIFTPSVSGIHYLVVEELHEIGTGTYTLRAVRSTIVDDYRGDTATTGVLTMGGQVTGEIELPADKDWFRVTLQAGTTCFFDLRGADGGGGTLGSGVSEARLVLYDDAGRYQQSAIDGGIGNDPLMSFTPAVSGTWYLGVEDLLDLGIGTYTLRASPRAPVPGRAIDGTAGDDAALAGGGGDDTIRGFAGTDTLTGTGGDDVLDGGTGLPAERDLATFSGPIAGYTLSRTGPTLTVTDRTTARDGTDTVTNIERLQFSDMGVNLTVQANAASIAQPTLDRICELYVGFFSRVPAADGLENWINQFKGGKSINTIANDFYGIGSSEALRAITGYWDFTNNRELTNQDFVKIVYRNVLGREGLQRGIDYWAGQLTGTDAKTRGELVSTMLDAAHGLKPDADWGWVANLLDDRITMSRRVAIEWGLNYGATAQQAIEKGAAVASAVDMSPNPNPAYSTIPVKHFDFTGATALIGVDPAGIDLIA